MANNRVFYACEAVGIAPDFGGPDAAVEIRGLQSVGINTTFNLTQVFEIGMLGLYQNIEGVADVEVTLEKVIDGHPLIYLLATGGGSGGTLISRSAVKCLVYMGIYPDTSDTALGNSSVTGGTCTVSGAFVSQVSYKIGIDGNATESVTLVANEKAWSSTAYSVGGSFAAGGLTATGVPLAASGVAQRQHLVMGSSASFFPNSIQGISSKANAITATGNAVAFQSASVSCAMGREQILELGRKTPYFRFVKFPVEVTTDFEVIAKTGDSVNVGESVADKVNEEIKLVFSQGLTIDLGTKNKLASVNFTGGGAGGDNATISYSYKTYNDFTVSQS